VEKCTQRYYDVYSKLTRLLSPFNRTPHHFCMTIYKLWVNVVCEVWGDQCASPVLVLSAMTLSTTLSHRQAIQTNLYICYQVGELFMIHFCCSFILIYNCWYTRVWLNVLLIMNVFATCLADTHAHELLLRERRAKLNTRSSDVLAMLLSCTTHTRAVVISVNNL
jgi:hypothetical protein